MMLSDDPQHGAHVAVAFQRRRECHRGTGHAVDWCEPLPPADRDAARTAATIPLGEAIMPVDPGVLGHVGDVIAWAVGQTGWAPP